MPESIVPRPLTPEVVARAIVKHRIDAALAELGTTSGKVTRRGSFASHKLNFAERVSRYDATREQLWDMLAEAELRWAKAEVGWKYELQALADAIPTDRSAGDSELMRALAQARLVLREGLQ